MKHGTIVHFKHTLKLTPVFTVNLIQGIKQYKNLSLLERL